MRKDMSKVVIDTYRHGDKSSKIRRAFRRRGDQEELPKQEAMRPKQQIGTYWAWDAKHYNLGDRTNPLRRFVEKQVGRNWDQVYSEICQHLNRNSTTHNHIFDHLFDFIKVKCYWNDGSLWATPYGRRFSGDVYPVEPGDVYVCPKSGMIRRMKGVRRKYRSRRSVDQNKFMNDGRNYEKIEGIWYEVVGVRRNPYKSRVYIHKPYGKPGHPGWPYRSYLAEPEVKQIIKEKRQLNHKELRNLKLRNN